jgi:starch-binding outer membrane protein, SusD/RagB family
MNYVINTLKRSPVYKAVVVVVFVLLSFCFSGCKKMLELEAPYTTINSANAFASDATATAVLTGIYMNMSNASFTGGGAFGGGGGITSLSLFPAMSADELTLFATSNSTYLNYYRNTLTSLNIGATDFWSILYKIVFTANTALKGLDESNTLSPAVKKQLLGEAKFVRAFAYLYLVKLYGDVPLALTIDPELNRLLSRSPKAQVYDQIIGDLKDAQNLLNSQYAKGDIITSTVTERIRPNKWAAAALLARTYLYKSDFSSAEAEATAVINNTTLYDTVSLTRTFLKDSKEAIWQLQPGLSNPSNTQDARLFVLPAGAPNNSYPVYLSNQIVSSFEAGDNRKTEWTGNIVTSGTTYYYPYKYRNPGTAAAVTEYLIVLRLAEQYLIRAEARAQQNNISGAQSDLNVIRKRARLGNTAATDKASLLSAIMQERKVELFAEWGHRWFDLKRTGTIDAVMNTVAPLKGTTWNTNSQLYPLPLGDIDRGVNLVQNPGYQ